jgi:hypothetical protein
LLGEKAVLQDAANRLNAKVHKAEEEVRIVSETKKAGERLRVGIEGVSFRPSYEFALTRKERNWTRPDGSFPT